MTRIRLLGTPVDLLSAEETLALASRAMEQRQSVRHTALNVAKLVRLERDPDLARDVRESDIVGIDGMGIVMALRLFGLRGAQRVAGIDLMHALLAHCAQSGRRPFILGASEATLRQAAARIGRDHPGIAFAGLQHGYFTPDEEAGIVRRIAQSGADCLFVAMPTPRKERFLHQHARQLGVPFVMGVGGAVDVLAGKVTRAPAWAQRAGLEWLHRLAQEPRRLGWRYLSTNTRFALMLLGQLILLRNPVERAEDGTKR